MAKESPTEPRVQEYLHCFLLEEPEKATCPQCLKGQAELGPGKGISGTGVGGLNRNKEALWVCLGGLTRWSPERCRVQDQEEVPEVDPPGQSSSWEASQGHCASGSYCLRSWNLLKVCQECGRLTHSSLRGHSLKFVKPGSQLLLAFSHSSKICPYASQLEPAGSQWGQESRIGSKETQEPSPS